MVSQLCPFVNSWQLSTFVDSQITYTEIKFTQRKTLLNNNLNNEVCPESIQFMAISVRVSNRYSQKEIV